jgi:hypothetical protein
MQSKPQIFEFTLEPKRHKNGEYESMHVTISTDGDSVSITGVSGSGDKFVGELILRNTAKAEGDQCWVCPKGKACTWEEPCPK